MPAPEPNVEMSINYSDKDTSYRYDNANSHLRLSVKGSLIQILDVWGDVVITMPIVFLKFVTRNLDD